MDQAHPVIRYESMQESGGNFCIEILGGRHYQVVIPSPLEKERFLKTVLAARAGTNQKLTLFEQDVVRLTPFERSRMQRRMASVPAGGGLISNLNLWENIILPVAYHQPRRIADLPQAVLDILSDLGKEDADIMDKLPETATVYEKRLAAFIRALLCAPEVLLFDALLAGLDAADQKQVKRFPLVYRNRVPAGTSVDVEPHDHGPQTERDYETVVISNEG